MKIVCGLVLLSSLLTSEVFAQRSSFAVGLGYGGAFGINESTEHPIGQHLRLSLLYLKGLSPTLSLELGGGHTRLSSGDAELFSSYETNMIPLDIRLRYSPMKKQQWSPFLFGGLGITLFEVTRVPANRDPGADTSGGNLFVTGGVGLFHKFAPNWAFDLTLGASTTFEDDLNPAHDGRSDGWWHGLIGVYYLLNNGNDADDDGLSDLDEVTKYKTDPHNADSEGDGLSDGEEILEYHTDPLSRDTDVDGAPDALEVNTLKTNPTNTDTDGDGLSDGQEFSTHHTNPLSRDSDGDGLTDSDEINKFRTNPLSVDSDNGSVPDGLEIGRGTNPLNPADDIKK